MSEMSEALDRMADHRSAAMTVNRSGWTREQYLADAERLMNDLDGSVSSLVNGHAMALIGAVRELRERVAELEDGIRSKCDQWDAEAPDAFAYVVTDSFRGLLVPEDTP